MIVPTPTSSNITNKVKHMQPQNAITLHHQPTPTCIVGATQGSPCLGYSPWHAHPTPSLPPYPHQIPKHLSRETPAISQKYRAPTNLFNSQKFIARNTRYFPKIPRIHQPLQFPKFIAQNARYFPKIPRTAAKHSQKDLVQLQNGHPDFHQCFFWRLPANTRRLCP